MLYTFVEPSVKKTIASKIRLSDQIITLFYIAEQYKRKRRYESSLIRLSANERGGTAMRSFYIYT